MTSASLLTPRTLTVGDLLLRPLAASDEPAVGEAMQDPGILRWAAGRVVNDAAPADRGRIWLAARLNAWANGTAAFAVTEADGGALLGYVGLRDVHRVPDQAVAAYWVTPAARGRAVAARALDAAATWAFRPAGGGGLGLHRISLDHALANPGSCRVATRAGFVTEGTLRECFIDHSGQRHDSHLHARLATDPRPNL
ncbi:GNAT family N-acetyltransferase [Actinacidiphila sp. DG2A-62]|jgi:RimJ/RimL family protein N-acetyltransferase|uniref:GNAT family N-acetyltransferase n=1 Tax=Actinacidiphila sp. DG2A-62 TaxID=3108821 RepID=UPI002DB5DCC6|nr:GNAT family N-acetyltransferase [Actinacidiphila sp. DG2A-62]MEC3995917.1 GNAT family N-acetyltransferase [Actinacidiphila sp. DG2A-62]